MLRTTGKAASRLSFANTEALNLSFSDRPIETHPSPRNSKKSFLFVIAHLGPGGAQRVAVNAANALVERGFDVHVTISGYQPIVYRVDPRVTFHSSSPVKSSLSGFRCRS